MKFILSVLLLVTLFVAGIPTSCLAANIVKVKVCGTALENGDDELVRQRALDDAKRKAAEAVLSRFIAPDDSQGSLYQAVLRRAPQFINGKIDKYKTRSNKGRYACYCIVPIDRDLITKEVRRQVKDLKERSNIADDMEVAFFMRARGIADGVLRKEIVNQVQIIYGQQFDLYAIKNTVDDELLRSIESNTSYGNAPLKEFMAGVVQEELPKHIDISIATIGDIEIGEIITKSNSVTVECRVNINLVRNLGDNNTETICRFADKYVLKRPVLPNNTVHQTIEKTIINATEKAAHQSASYLCSMLLRNWQEKTGFSFH